MNLALHIVLGSLGGLLAFCTAYQLLWMIASIPSLFRPARRDEEGGPATRFAVLIPAHDEETLIGETVRSLLGSSYPESLRRVFVIADNCSDRTAEVAAAAGARVLVRNNPQLRGKPHALAWAIDQLDLDQYDAVVIVDGDTAVDAVFLTAMDAHVRRGAHAIQGYYGVLNPDENWLTRLSLVPAAIKFRLHFPGKLAFGLSCPLAGNGMCFSREVIARFGWNAFSLTENWEYYIILTLHGYVVSSAPEAVIYAQVARSLKLGETQRMRWMKGRIETLQKYWRPLVGQGLLDPSPVKLDALVELARPSYSMLFIWSVGYLMACAVLTIAGLVNTGWLVAAGVMVAAQAGYILAGVAVGRPSPATWLALASVPFYLGWKLAVSLKGLLTIKDKAWVKTTRH